VQAGAAVLAFGVTVWLAVLTRRYVRLTDRYVRTTEEIAGSSRRQVEGVVEAGRRSQRAVAAALLQEVQRIRTELGPRPSNERSLQGTGLRLMVGGGIVPQVHRWLEPVIPRVAESDPAVVGLFLRLDRDLHNYRVTVRRVEQARRDLADKERIKAAARAHELTPSLEAQQALKVADENVGRRLTDAELAYQACHRELERL